VLGSNIHRRSSGEGDLVTKVMVWGCFSYGGVGRVNHIHGIMNAARCHAILQHQRFPSADAYSLAFIEHFNRIMIRSKRHVHQVMISVDEQ
jgi:crotonobetainyl-CoA:carnitine CoA-transferase CaiB-like acyl-CoA transferase